MSDHLDIEKLPLEIDGIPVRETIREIFRNPENGTSDNISKAGCLALAKKSNEVGGGARGESKTHVLWNAWRTVFPTRGSTTNRVDFSGVNFRKTPLDNGLSFEGMEFGDWANFNSTLFEGFANFVAAQFGDLANFRAAKFTRGANFTAAQFGYGADFCGAQFGPIAMFKAVQFGPEADFRASKFINSADFSAKTWAEVGEFYGSRLAAAKEWASARGLTPDTFQKIDFSGAVFDEEVVFSDRKFLGTTSFASLPNDFTYESVERDENCNPVSDGKGSRKSVKKSLKHHHRSFGRPPIFHGCKIHQDTSFTLEDQFFPKAGGGDKAASAYCTLKRAFSEHHAIREEQFFFRLEMKEETIRATGLKWFLYQCYKCLSDYGFSVFRPLLIWLVLAVISSGLYVKPPGEETCILWTQYCSWDTEAFGQSLFQAVPFGGLAELKDSTYECWQAAGIVLHKAFSLVLLFLASLALRNLFKLK